MTIPDFVGAVRSASPEELPLVLSELAAATAMAEKRMQYAPPKPVTVVLDEPEYTVPEVAEILRRSIKSVYAMCVRQRDPIPSRQYGRTRRVPRGMFNEWRQRQGGRF